MKRFWQGVAAAAVVAASAGTTFADTPAPIVSMNAPTTTSPGALPGPETYSGTTTAETASPASQRYGLLPLFRRGWSGRSNYGACASCETPRRGGLFGHGGSGGSGNMGAQQMPGAGVPGVPQPGQPGMGMPGTLVFPSHPFARGPRDFFMADKADR